MPVPSGIKETIKFVDMKAIKEGDMFKITSDFLEAEATQAKYPMCKFPKFLNGLVELCDGSQALLGIGKASYYKLSEKFGRDTSAWVGKLIVYKGKVKVGKAPLPAHIFEPAQ